MESEGASATAPATPSGSIPPESTIAPSHASIKAGGKGSAAPKATEKFEEE
jgi:hypothetical protein